MITGLHAIINSKNHDADRDFFKKIIKLTNVDVGDGWLIFGLPPSEIAIHPSEGSSHELYMMCDDIEEFIMQMKKNNISCEKPQDQGWGILSSIKMPGGGSLGVYQPRHARPEPMKLKSTISKKKKSPTKKKPSPPKRKKR